MKKKTKRGAKPKFGEKTVPVPFRLPESHVTDLKVIFYAELTKPKYLKPKP